jgi:hypothetical protein
MQVNFNRLEDSEEKLKKWIKKYGKLSEGNVKMAKELKELRDTYIFVQKTNEALNDEIEKLREGLNGINKIILNLEVKLED